MLVYFASFQKSKKCGAFILDLQAFPKNFKEIYRAEKPDGYEIKDFIRFPAKPGSRNMQGADPDRVQWTKKEGGSPLP